METTEDKMETTDLTRLKQELSERRVVERIMVAFYAVTTGYCVYTFLQGGHIINVAMGVVAVIGAIDSIICSACYFFAKWSLDLRASDDSLSLKSH